MEKLRIEFNALLKLKDMISNKSKFNKTIDILVLIFYGLMIWSIPTLSFDYYGKYVTWFLTIFLFILIFISFFLFYEIKFDSISFSLLMFSISAFMSSMLIGFKGFNFTPIFLSIALLIFYTYFKSCVKKVDFPLVYFILFISITVFLLFFILKYSKELFTLNFNRLGGFFGDVNDISLFFSLGLILCSYFLFFVKNIIINICSLLLLPFYVLCGLSTGSKTFILILVVSVFLMTISFFGKKRWWASALVIFLLTFAFVLIITLPAFESLKKRLVSFLETVFVLNENAGPLDMSTQHRYHMFKTGVDMWLKRCLFGWGIWGFATNSGGYNSWSHNNISEILCNFGIFGALFFHYPIIKAIYHFSKSKNKRTHYIDLFCLAFYLTAMLSIALNSQKLYAFVAGLAFASVSDDDNFLVLNFKKNNYRRKEIKYEDC